MAGDYRFPQVSYGQTIEETVDNLMGAVTILRKELMYHMNNLDSDNITNIDAGVTNVIGITSTMVSGLSTGAGVISTGGAYYVRINGSDTNSGLSNDSTGAFLTLARGVAAVPEIFTGFNFTVYVTGAYAETLTVQNRTCGGQGLYVTGLSDTSLAYPFLNSVSLSNIVGQVEIGNMSMNSSSYRGITIDNCDNVKIYDCDAGSTSVTNDDGAYVTRSNVWFSGYTALNRDNGIIADYNSKVTVSNGIITANDYAVYAYEGAIISIDTASTMSGGIAKCLAEDGGLVIDASSGGPAVLYY